MKLKSLVAAVAVAGVGALGLVASQPASAATSPSITWKFDSSVDAGVRPRFQYLITGAASTDKLRLQRLISGKWTSVTGLAPSKKLTFDTTAGVPMGEYQYRVAVFTSKGSLRKAVTHRLLSYDTVLLKDFKNTPDEETVDVAGTPFPYVFVFGYENYEEIGQAASTCKSGTLQVASVPDYTGPVDSDAGVTYRSVDGSFSTDIPKDTISKFYLGISIGRPWKVDAGTDEAGSGYLNGSFACYAIPTYVEPPPMG